MNRGQGRGRGNAGRGKGRKTQTRIQLEYLVAPEDPSFRRAFGLLHSLLLKFLASNTNNKSTATPPDWIKKLTQELVFLRPAYLLWWKELLGTATPNLINEDDVQNIARPIDVEQILDALYGKAGAETDLPPEWKDHVKLFLYFHLVNQMSRKDPLKLVSQMWERTESMSLDKVTSPWPPQSDQSLSAPTYGSVAIAFDQFVAWKGLQPKVDRGDTVARMTLVDLADILTRYDCIGLRTLLRMCGQGELMRVESGDPWDVINDMDAPFIVFPDNRPQEVATQKYLSEASTARFGFHIPQSVLMERMAYPTRMCLLLPGFFADTEGKPPTTLPKVVGLSSWMVHPRARAWNYVDLFERLVDEDVGRQGDLQTALFRFFNALPQGVAALPTLLPGVDKLCTLRHRHFSPVMQLRALVKMDRLHASRNSPEERAKYVGIVKEEWRKRMLTPGSLGATRVDPSCLNPNEEAANAEIERLLNMFVDHLYAWKALDRLHDAAKTLIWVPLLVPARGYGLDIANAVQKLKKLTSDVRERRTKNMEYYREDIVFCPTHRLEASEEGGRLRDDGRWASDAGYLDRLLQGSLEQRHIGSYAFLPEHVLCGVSFRATNVFSTQEDDSPQEHIELREVVIFVPDEYYLETFVTAQAVWTSFAETVAQHYFDVGSKRLRILNRVTVQSIDGTKSPFNNGSTYTTALKEHYKVAKDAKMDRNTLLVQRLLMRAGLLSNERPEHFRQHHFERALAIEYIAIPLDDPVGSNDEYVVQKMVQELYMKDRGQHDYDRIFVYYKNADSNLLLYALESLARRFQVYGNGGGMPLVALNQMLPRIVVYKKDASLSAQSPWRLVTLDEASVRQSVFAQEYKWQLLSNTFFEAKTQQAKKNQKQPKQLTQTWTYKTNVPLRGLIEGFFRHLGLDTQMLVEHFGQSTTAVPVKP